jgi:uncharacterized protein (TIGR02246 family)
MRKLAVCAFALTVAATIAAPTVGFSATSSGKGGHGHHKSCEEKFDEAQRQDMESFRDYDAEAFADVHHPDATSVFAVGEVAIGRDAIMEALAGYFEAQTSHWSWTEITRNVEGCRTGVIVYRTLIERPGFARHAINTVTYTYEHGRFLAISDQGTEVAAPAE